MTRSRRSGGRPRPFDARPQATYIPPVPLSETLLDFAEPVLAALEEPPPDELLERLMMIVVTIWNAHAMALPVWGEPEHLSSLRDTVYQQGSPAELAELFELLSRRREQRFANDPRVVGDHRISRTDGSFRLSCDGKLPRRSLPPR